MSNRVNYSSVNRSTILLFLLFLAVFECLVGRTESAILLVDPSFLLVEEDWPISTYLPVTLCPKNVKIISGDPSNHFQVTKINDTCATLQLNLAFDADKESDDGVRGQSFSLVISGPKKSRATLEIQVVDVNDNAPQFYNTATTFEISENAAISDEVFKVQTKDPDTGISGISRFSIEGTDNFTLDKRRCDNGKCSTTLRIGQRLDYESKRIHVFNITAKDGDPHSNRTHTVTHTVTINVKKANNKPTFITDFSNIFSIPLNSKPGNIVTKIEADDEEKSEIFYSISKNDNFIIDSKSGNILLKQLPEQGKLLTLKITASEVGENGKSATREMKLKVAENPDVKEEEKENKFETQLCEFPIYEARLVEGTGKFDSPVLIKTLTPTTKEIILIGGENSFDLIARADFQLELVVKNADKVVAQNLDSAQLMIKSTTGHCQIVLKSVPPNFEKNYPILQKTKLVQNGPENNQSCDDNAGKSSISCAREVENHSEDPDKFRLVEKATGKNEVFNLPGASAKSELVTHVIDDNNYSSVFEKDRFLINIIEGQSKKVQIVVPKFAEGKNGHISYSISEKINLPVHIANGVLFVGAIDREAMADSIVNLTITASDTEKPARNSTTVVTIRVKDINDNPPIFSNSRYSIVLGAFISPGGVVGKISATDKDATSPNNYVHYFSHDPQFKISDEGEIVFMGSGILQKDDHMQFNITATDGGKPPLSATAKVVINEHRGKTNGVQNEVTTQISSNDTVEKSEIKWLNAGMSGYTYEIIKATVNGFEDQKVMEWLKIDKKTGRIETLKRIDPVKVKTIKVYISMRKGKREVPVELIINVTDADEITSSYMKSAVPRNFTTPEPGTIAAEVGAQPTEGVRPEIRVKPIFKNSSVFTTFINEDSILGTVLSLPYPLATNSDDGHIGGLLYSMTENEPYFKIDEKNSTIRLIAPLDFKTQKMHFLNIKCVDNNGELPYHESFASVVVNVINAKNNYPVISNTDLLHLNVGEDAKPETVITIFKVSDADGFEKTQLDVNSSMFKVDESFKLLVATSLKGYAGQRLCSTVTARNKQDRVATSPYCVTVYPAKNTHHNPLVISPKQNSIHYFDENIVYDELLKFTVLEEYESSKVTFRLNEMFKKDWQLFSIDKNNGSLKSKQPFDFEKKTVHEIKILTCQADNCSSTHLFISVNDRNDNCPMFPKQDVRLTVLENEKGKRQVGRIPAALDSDFHSDNTKVCYTTDTLIFFFSDPTLPILFTNSSFDREHKKQHQITINAYDCNLSCRDPHQPMNGTIVALIDVIDVNDNFPKFTKKSYASTVVQGQAMAGSHILTVQATDLDDELNGLAYSLRGFVRSPTQTFTLSESPISVDQSTGEVIANELLKESSYYFTVIVVDSAGHEDTASVMVSVVTYAQQTELVFDAPFELIMKNEKNISDDLSHATGLQTIVDKCRQNSNFTLMLVHFTTHDGQFVNIEQAINRLMTSTTESRKKLKSVYGLREAFPLEPLPSKLPQFFAIAVSSFFFSFLLCLCIWCRKRNNYERKLRHISAQASTVHTVSLGRNKKGNPAYNEIQIAARYHPPPALPQPVTVNLQSTEL